MDLSGTYLCLEQFRHFMIIPVGVLVLHYVTLLNPAQNPRSSWLRDTVWTICLVAPCIYMFPVDMVKYHTLALWTFVNCSTREGAVAMLSVQAFLLLSPVPDSVGWYNICICLPGLWSVIRPADAHSTDQGLIPEKESASNGGGVKTAEPAASVVHIKDENVRATKRIEDNENKRQAVVDNATKGHTSDDSHISTGDNKDTQRSYAVTGVSGGTVNESITAGYVGRDINYEKTIRDNVVSGPSNIDGIVHQATEKGLSASGSFADMEVDDPEDSQHDSSLVTDSSLVNTHMKNVYISGNPDLSRIDGRSCEVTKADVDGDCDDYSGSGTPQNAQDSIRRSGRNSNTREAIEIQNFLKDIKYNASEASSVVATTMKRVANISLQVENDVDQLRSKVTAEDESFKKAKREAEEACSSFAALTNHVASRTRQFENEMDQLHSKVADFTTVIDALRKAIQDVREATVTIATTKHEEARQSRQEMGPLSKFLSGAVGFNAVMNTPKRRTCNCQCNCD